MIDVTKCKRRDGGKFVVYTTDGKDPEQPIVGEYETLYTHRWATIRWSADGKLLDGDNPLDLIEVGPYDHINPGDLVMVWDNAPQGALLRVFAGVNERGDPLAYYWINCIDKVAWKHCLTVEEYADKYLREAAKEEHE